MADPINTIIKDAVENPTPLSGGKPRKFTKQQVADALSARFGNMTMAAALLKCERGTVYDYVERYPELKEIRPKKRVEIFEMAETHYLAAVRDGRQWAVEKALRLFGKEQGYDEAREASLEVEMGVGQDGFNMTIRYVEGGGEDGQ